MLMRYLQSGLVIAGIQHPDQRSESKWLRLVPADSPTGDALRIAYALSARRKQHRVDEREDAYALHAEGICMPGRAAFAPATDRASTTRGRCRLATRSAPTRCTRPAVSMGRETSSSRTVRDSRIFRRRP